MNNFTMHIIKAAAMTLVAAVCITVQAAGPKRVVQVQKAKKQVVITDVNSDVTPAPLKIRPNNASAAQLEGYRRLDGNSRHHQVLGFIILRAGHIHRPLND